METENPSNTSENVANVSTDASSEEESETEQKAPRGMPKSGRFWKSVKTRTRSVVKTPGLQMPLEKKLKLRQELAYNKSLSREFLDKRKKAKEDLRLRRLNNIKRKEENQKKSEIVQVIRNTNKIKKMSKKQLKTIEKRDTLNMK